MKNGRVTEALETRDHFKATYGEATFGSLCLLLIWGI